MSGSEASESLKISLEHEMGGNYVLINNDLQISFERTIRVPDNAHASHLPPSLGSFTLKPISNFSSRIDPAMAAKGGPTFAHVS